MKILELKLIAFGPFSGEVLDLSGGSEGLHLLYGANEAGKSSALRALRQLFYGIPRNSTDGFLHPFPKMRIGASIRRSDGERLDFLRRKGIKNTLRAADDREVIPESTLRQLLGQVDGATFRTLFGIDHDSLVEGGKEVLKGDGDVGQMLFAAGAGVSGLRELLQSLEDETEQLFKPRGQNQTLNRLIGQLEKTRREIREAALPSSEWKERQTALDAARRQLKTVERELRDLRRQRNRLERIADALPLIARRRNALAGLEKVKTTPLLREEFTSERQEALNQLNVARERENGAIEEKKELVRQMKQLDVPQGLLERGDEIEHLRGEIASCRKALSDLRGLEAQREQLETDARGTLRYLRPDLDLKGVSALRLSAGERVAIQNLGNQKQALEERCGAGEAAVNDLSRRLDAASEELRNLEEPRRTDELQAAIRRVRKDGNQEEQLERASKELKELEEQAAVDLERLGLWKESLEELEKLALPPEETVDRYEGVFAELDRSRQSLEERIEETRLQDAEYERRLEALRLEQEVPSEKDLADARRQRDEGWRRVREAWETGEPSGGSTLAEAYEESVRGADEISDRLRREAERVAEMAQLVASRRQLAAILTSFEEELARVGSKREALTAEWTTLWQSLGIEPWSPREMRTWLQRERELVDEAAELRRRRQAVKRLKESVAAVRRELSLLMEALGEPAAAKKEVLEALIERSEAVLERIALANERRRELQRSIRQLEGSLENTRGEAKKAAGSYAAWGERWKEATNRLGLPEDATPAQANEVLERIGELFDKLKNAAGLRERIEAIQRDAGRLERVLRELAAQVAPDLAWLPFEECAAELIDRHTKALEDAQRLVSLRQQKTREEAKLREARATMEDVRGRVLCLCQEAGCPSHEELPEVERRSLERRQIERQLGELNEQLVLLAGTKTIEDFIEEAEEVDRDALHPRIDKLEEKVETLEEKRSQLDRTLGSETNALETLQKGSRVARAAEKAEEAQELLARIASRAGEYVQLRLAAALLRRGIERYRKQHQGPVLRRAGALFQRLTVGSFSELEVDVDGNNEPFLLGVRPGGADKVTVDGMSDGSRDQLYLALRLATLERYLERNPPLPFIVDDILVNFDDERATATLEVLAELSQETQVIFFTHHLHLLELARKAVPEEVLEIQELPEGLETADENILE